MKNKIISKLSAIKGDVGFYYKNLSTGEQIVYNENRVFPSASVIKIFMLACCLKQCENGKLQKEDIITITSDKHIGTCGALCYMHSGLKVTIKDLYTLMSILSDNTATNYIFDILGFDTINEFIKDNGFKNTIAGRKMFDWASVQRGVDNFTTPFEAALLFERIYKNEILSKSSCREMLDILIEQQYNDKIPFYISAEDNPPSIAHKTGGLDNLSHDVGIVFAKQPFVISFFGEKLNVSELNKAMGEISYMLYMKNNI